MAPGLVDRPSRSEPAADQNPWDVLAEPQEDADANKVQPSEMPPNKPIAVDDAEDNNLTSLRMEDDAWRPPTSGADVIARLANFDDASISPHTWSSVVNTWTDPDAPIVQMTRPLRWAARELLGVDNIESVDPDDLERRLDRCDAVIEEAQALTLGELARSSPRERPAWARALPIAKKYRATALRPGAILREFQGQPHQLELVSLALLGSDHVVCTVESPDCRTTTRLDHNSPTFDPTRPSTRAAIDVELAEGAWWPVQNFAEISTDSVERLWLNPLATREKGAGRPDRIIVDCTARRRQHVFGPNQYVPTRFIPGPKMTRLAELATWVATCDSSNRGRVHLAVCDASRAYRRIPLLTACWLAYASRPSDEVGLVIDTRNPMGSVAAAGFACLLSGSVARLIRARFPNVFSGAYIDDLIVAATTQTEAAAAMEELHRVMDVIGFPRAPDKDQPPAQEVTYLGFVVRYDAQQQQWMMELSPKKRRKLLEQLDTLSVPRSATQKMRQSLFGRLIHASSLGVGFKLVCTPLMQMLVSQRSGWSPGQAREAARTRNLLDRDDVIRAPLLHLSTRREADVKVWVDSSGHGFGVVVADKHAVRPFLLLAQGRWQTHQAHSVWHETLGIAVVIIRCARRWAGRLVELHTDNVAAAALFKPHTLSHLAHPRFQDLTERIANAMIRWQVQVRVTHRPGRTMQLPDLLSRTECSDDASWDQLWKISRRWVREHVPSHARLLKKAARNVQDWSPAWLTTQNTQPSLVYQAGPNETRWALRHGRSHGICAPEESPTPKRCTKPCPTSSQDLSCGCAARTDYDRSQPTRTGERSYESTPSRTRARERTLTDTRSCHHFRVSSSGHLCTRTKACEGTPCRSPSYVSSLKIVNAPSASERSSPRRGTSCCGWEMYSHNHGRDAPTDPSPTTGWCSLATAPDIHFESTARCAQEPSRSRICRVTRTHTRSEPTAPTSYEPQWTKPAQKGGTHPLSCHEGQMGARSTSPQNSQHSYCSRRDGVAVLMGSDSSDTPSAKDQRRRDTWLENQMSGLSMPEDGGERRGKPTCARKC